MKAVIMAGGKGTRLNPLTCNIPKPMVPLVGRPCMEYIIELLKNHGITEIGVTVQHLSRIIRSYFGNGSRYGVNLNFFEELTPLGTAGSVKNMEEFLDEDSFLVISGDALTDFDLTGAIAFHKRMGATATLVTTRVEDPTQYGVVLADGDGLINRFMEKPRWSEVFSNMVNTGIYILQRDVLTYFDKGVSFDFSKNLFPMLMKSGKPLYAFDAQGYWTDIGSLAQYRQSQFDMLEGRVNVRLVGDEIAPGVCIGDNVKIGNRAFISGPSYIGSNSVVKDGALVGGYSIIGSGNLLSEGVTIDNSIVWDDNYIDGDSSISGAVVCNQVLVSRDVEINDGAVIGDGCVLGQKICIESGVKAFPNKVILEKSLAYGSGLWTRRIPRLSVFGSDYGAAAAPAVGEV